MLFDTKDFGFRVKMLRKCSGLTQEQLAEKLHISISHLAKIEIGRNAPSVDLVLEMAEFFGVTVDELLRGDKEEILSPEGVVAKLVSLSKEIADLSIYFRNAKL